MKVLVTGASGFLGSHIAEQLARDGHAVRVLVRRTSDRSFLRGFDTEEALGDVTQPESLPAAIAGVDAVVHAGHGGGQGLRLGDVARRLFGLESPQEGAIASAADQHAHGVPLVGELLCDM